MLFDIKKEEKPVAETKGGGLPFEGEHKFPKSRKLADVLTLVQENSCVHWVSEGDWSMHDLLVSLLNISGPADVYISSYAFSEFPARIVAELKREGTIRDLHCLIDNRLDVRNPSALTIIQNISTRLKLLQTHSKVTVIENEHHHIVALGSANYTNNRRFETGVIICSAVAAAFHLNWMRYAFEKNN